VQLVLRPVPRELVVIGRSALTVSAATAEELSSFWLGMSLESYAPCASRGTQLNGVGVGVGVGGVGVGSVSAGGWQRHWKCHWSSSYLKRLV
jgi:hypothetical protein